MGDVSMGGPTGLVNGRSQEETIKVNLDTRTPAKKAEASADARIAAQDAGRQAFAQLFPTKFSAPDSGPTLRPQIVRVIRKSIAP
jgi:hypothetical protein